MNLCRTYLADRGITDETVKTHGLEFDDRPNANARIRLGRTLPKSINEVLWFPLHDKEGNVGGYIARPLPNVAGEPKFRCPDDSNGPPYIPSSVYKLPVGRPLIITEGPLKALACLQAGVDAIGLNGVYGAGVKDSSGEVRIRADLFKALEWRGRKVYLGFDADQDINPDVRQAMFRLYFLLASVGAEIYQLTTWDIRLGKGIDDYLVNQFRSNGEHPLADVLSSLLSNAKLFIETIQPTSLDLGLITSELRKVHLPDLLRQQLCGELAKRLKVSVDGLRAIGPEQETASGPVFASDPEPWPDPVNGDTLLYDLTKYILRHVVIDGHSAVAVALYTVLTYLTDFVDILPLLVILSPTKRCGKTRLLGVLTRLVRRAFGCVSVTPATLYRAIEKWHPTLLIDEGDTLFKDKKGNDNAELRTVINAGHTRDFAFVPRCAGDSYEVEIFSTWTPKVIALVGKLPDSMFDRSIPVYLRRRNKDEGVKPLRDTPASEWLELRRKLIRFAAENDEDIKKTKPALPEGLNDRAEDNWIPLLAIAEVIKGDWPGFAKDAALELSKSDSDQESIAIQLLSAIRKIYQDAKMTGEEGFLSSLSLVKKLNDDAEGGWCDWRKGKGISVERLASQLRRFEARSEQTTTKPQVRGYYYMDLKPVFDRYL